MGYCNVLRSTLFVGVCACLVCSVGLPGCEMMKLPNDEVAATPADDAEAEAARRSQDYADRAAEALADSPGSGGASQVQWERTPSGPDAPPRPASDAPRIEPTRTATSPPTGPTPQADVAAITSDQSPESPLRTEPDLRPTDPSVAQILAQLNRRLTAQALRQRDGLKPWLGKAALALIDPRFEIQSTELALLSEQDRTLILAWQRTFAQIGRTLGKDVQSDREQLLLAVTELAEQLEGFATLQLRNVRLCKLVKGYGVFQPFKTNRFLVGREHPVILYAEIENFQPETDPTGQYVVRLTQEVALYTATSDALRIWRTGPVALDDDRSRNRRRDFYTTHPIRLPARLPPNRYLLKLTVTDQVAQTVDEATLPIEVVADQKLVTGE